MYGWSDYAAWHSSSAKNDKNSKLTIPYLNRLRNNWEVMTNTLLDSNNNFHIYAFQLSGYLLPWIVLICVISLLAYIISSSSPNNSATLGNFYFIYWAYYSTNYIVFAKKTTFLLGIN